MKIISIETSGPVCSVALSDGDLIISELSNSDGNRHDELCAEFVRKLLTQNNLTIANIDAIAVSSGPGSFTGLRIGASIAKALCFKESEKDYAPKLIAVPTLSVFANEALENINFSSSVNFPKVPNFRKVDYSKIITVIPAQKDVLYYQEFYRHPEPVEGEVKKIGSRFTVHGSHSTDVSRFAFHGSPPTEIKICNIDDFKKLDFKDTLICGPMQKAFEELPAPPYLIEYSARIIANLAIRKYILGEFTDANTFKPLYVQDFQLKTKKKELNI